MTNEFVLVDIEQEDPQYKRQRPPERLNID